MGFRAYGKTFFHQKYIRSCYSVRGNQPHFIKFIRVATTPVSHQFGSFPHFNRDIPKTLIHMLPNSVGPTKPIWWSTFKPFWKLKIIFATCVCPNIHSAMHCTDWETTENDSPLIVRNERLHMAENRCLIRKMLTPCHRMFPLNPKNIIILNLCTWQLLLVVTCHVQETVGLYSILI